MLRWRLLLGALLIAALVALCWLDVHAKQPRTFLIPLAMLLSVVASGEVLWLLKARDLKPIAHVVYLGNLIILASNAVHFVCTSCADTPLERLAWPLVALTGCVLWAFGAEMRRYQRPGGVIVNLALAIFSLFYVGVLLSFMVQLLLLEQVGMIALASMIAIVKVADTSAYFTGRTLGQHKLAPVLSPGKSVEGAIGAIAGACLASWLILEVVVPHLVGQTSAKPQGGWIVYGVVVGLAGMLGDLAESLLKRDMGQKDSSDWLPGFGGVLDVLDSLLVGAPAAYVCWLIGLV